MDVREESTLHFGAQRGGPDNSPRIRDSLNSSPQPDNQGRTLLLENARAENYNERRRGIEKIIREKELELQDLDNSYGNRNEPILSPQREVNYSSRYESKVPQSKISSFSTEQLSDIVKLIQMVQQTSGCSASERAHEQRLIEIAPRFNLRDVKASWEAFEVFFDINRVNSNQLKFDILNGRLPWETMQQFGKEYPNSGGDYKKLEMFLLAHTKEFSPCMHHCRSVGKYGPGTLLRDVFHESKIMADLERDERIKLNACLLSSGDNKRIVEEFMHLPLDKFFSKVSQKWHEESVPKVVHHQQYPSRNYVPKWNEGNLPNVVEPRQYPNTNYSPTRRYREYRNTSHGRPRYGKREQKNQSGNVDINNIYGNEQPRVTFSENFEEQPGTSMSQGNGHSQV